MRMKLSVIIIVITVIIAASSGVTEDENKLIVSSFQGEVSCLKLDKWIPAEIGLQLAMGDSVKTGKDSFCDVSFGETSFRVKENSFLTITDILKKIELQIEYGSILAKIKNLPPESEFVVKTPQAVIGARGTRYKVYVKRYPAVTHASVIEKTIICRCHKQPHRSVVVKQYKTTEFAPWKTAIIRAKGAGILSEKMLGSLAIKKLRSDIFLKSSGDTKKKALSNLAEELQAIHLDKKITIGDILSEDTGLLKRVYHYIAKSAVISTVTKDDKLTVEAEIMLDPVEKIIGRDIFATSKVIQPISEEAYMKKFGALARVTTKRAATVDGYRKLAETIYGAVIDSKTTLEDFAVKDDTIKTRVTGIVRGAREIGIEYFSDGSIAVLLETEARRIKEDLTPYTGDVFGVYYIAKPTIIRIDDFEEYLLEE